MKNLSIKSAIVIVVLMFTVSACTVIKPGYKAMKWKPWGKGLKTDKIYNNGPVYHWPWISMVNYNTKWQTFSEGISILTKDELHINIQVSITLRPIIDQLPQLELNVGKDYYNTVVKPEFISLTRNIFSDYDYSVVSPMSTEIENKIYQKLMDKVKDKYLEIDNVTIDHIVYPSVVSSAVNKKLAVQQDIEQKDYEIAIAKKTAEIQRILARGQRDAQTIIDSSITLKYLQYKALEVQDKLSTSPNAKFFFVPLGKDGLPIIIDTGESKKR